VLARQHRQTPKSPSQKQKHSPPSAEPSRAQKQNRITAKRALRGVIPGLRYAVIGHWIRTPDADDPQWYEAAPPFIQDSEIKTLKTNPHDKGNKTHERKQCPKCGDVHWVNLRDPDQCMTYMRACGKTPKNWDDQKESLRKTIDEKAVLLRDQQPPVQTVQAGGHAHQRSCKGGRHRSREQDLMAMVVVEGQLVEGEMAEG